MRELNELNNEIIALEGLLIKDGVDTSYLYQLKVCYMEKYECFNTRLIERTIQPLVEALEEYYLHIKDNYDFIHGVKKRDG